MGSISQALSTQSIDPRERGRKRRKAYINARNPRTHSNIQSKDSRTLRLHLPRSLSLHWQSESGDKTHPSTHATQRERKEPLMIVCVLVFAHVSFDLENGSPPFFILLLVLIQFAMSCGLAESPLRKASKQASKQAVSLSKLIVIDTNFPLNAIVPPMHCGLRITTKIPTLLLLLRFLLESCLIINCIHSFIHPSMM